MLAFFLAESMINLALAKKQVNAEEHDLDDTLIQGFIDAAYRYAENKTGTCFEPRDITVVLDSLPQAAERITFELTPVREVVSFNYVDTTGQTQDIDPAELRLDTRPLYPTLAPKFGSQWPALIAEPESVTITLAVGYEQTPADAQAAMLLLIGHLYANREATSAVALSAVPFGVDMLLAPYTIVRIG